MTETEQTSTPQARVFISYSRKDVSFVDRLAAALTARGYDAFLDREDISAGEAWQERIEALILQADAVVFVMSPDSISSPICKWEAARTVELGKRLIPLCHRRIENDTAPEPLARLNYIFVATEDEFDEGVARLCAACDVDIAWVREHTRLVEAASHWDANARARDVLLRGAALSNAENWLARRQHLAPSVPEILDAYLQESRIAEATEQDKARRSLQRTQRLQLGVWSLVAVSAMIVLVGALVVARMIAGIGQRTSDTLAEISHRAYAEFGSNGEAAARYATAGLAGADWPLLGFNSRKAEDALRGPIVQLSSIELRGHEGGVIRASFSPDGARVLTASWDHTARVWDTSTGREIAVLRVQEPRVESAAFSPDGRRLVIAHGNNATVWSTTTWRQTAVLLGHGAAVIDASFSPDGARIVTASLDRTVGVWDATGGQQIAILRGHLGGVSRAMFNPNGRLVLTASDDNSVRVWNAIGWETNAILRHEGVIESAEFSPDGERIVTTARDGTARLWSAVSGRQIAILRDRESMIIHAAFSPDGARIVASLVSFVALLWDPDNGTQTTLTGHSSGVVGGAFSPNGIYAVTASFDDTARLWEVATGREVVALRGHTGSVQSAVFSPDGTRVLTASADYTARIWPLSRVLNASREDLIKMSCEGPLARASRLSAAELRAAPMLDPTLDADACHPPTLMHRLRLYLG